MTDRVRNFWVGLFVLSALGVLGAMMVWFGEVPDWLSKGEWTLRITDVQNLYGISDGSPVRLNGVEIGRVRSLDFVDRERPDLGVVVIARIHQQFSVPRGATARVFGAALGFGTGHVDIVLPPGRDREPLAKDDASIPGEMRSVIGEIIRPEMMDSLQRTLDHLGNLAASTQPVMDNLAQLIETRGIAEVEAPGAAERGAIANLSTVLERFDRFIMHLNAVLGDASVQEDVKTAVRDLKNVTEELHATVALWKSETERLSENLNAGIDRTEENLEQSFVRLNQVLENLNDSTRAMAMVMTDIQEGRGTLGLLASDPRLYEAAVLSAERLAEVMNNLQVITGKIMNDGYITVGQAPSGVLRKNFDIPVKASDFP